jgi:Ca2+-binding RTX toxin-like protein
VQVRAAAWSLRQLENAAWAAPDGSKEQAYFRATADANWKWLVAQIPEWTAQQGEAHGYLPPLGSDKALGPWQVDYVASTAISAASRGSADALTFLNWMKNFLIGRFMQPENVFSARDGVTYILAVGPEDGPGFYKTWAEISQVTKSYGLSQAADWDGALAGDYAQSALATLAGIYYLTGDIKAKEAYFKLLALEPLLAARGDFENTPNYAVLFPGVYADTPLDPNMEIPLSTPPAQTGSNSGGGTSPGSGSNGSAGDDAVVLTAVANGSVIDLGGGADRLTLSSAGPNTLTVNNTETIIGGSAADNVTLGTAVSGANVNLGGGADRLTLSSAGPNTLTVSNTETIIGGSQADNVTLGTAVSGATVNLVGGLDRLTLSSVGPNTLTVSSTETIIGGSQADNVTLSSTASGAVVDLGGGLDRLTLSSVGPNTLTVSNTETIIGGSQADNVTLSSTVSGAVVDLGGGLDRLTLSSAGPNTLTVSNTETVIGGSQADYLRVQSGGTVLAGGDGDDTIFGGSSRDLIAGGRGNDLLTGGGGADVFTFGDVGELRALGGTAPASPPPTDRSLVGVDRITDFVSGMDVIQLNHLDANTALAGYQGFRYLGQTTTVAANSLSWFWNNDGNTVIRADVNGNTTPDLVIELIGKIQLTTADFVF